MALIPKSKPEVSHIVNISTTSDNCIMELSLGQKDKALNLKTQDHWHKDFYDRIGINLFVANIEVCIASIKHDLHVLLSL